MIDKGTNFNVLCPVDPTCEYGTRLPGSLSLLTESSVSELRQIETLFDITTVSMLENSKAASAADSHHLDSLYSYTFPAMPIDNREDEAELWQKIYKIRKQGFESAKFRALNFENLSLSGSQLFRFLGRWELEFGGKHLIIYNISNNLFFELTKINKDYTQRIQGHNPDFPYWNEKTMTLVYSFTSDENARFHFTDALWGKEKQGFIAINKLLKNTNFYNSVSLLRDSLDIGEAEKLPANVTALLQRFDFFYDGTTLLPFDLLLRCQSGESIFEQNAHFLLMNSLSTE